MFVRIVKMSFEADNISDFLDTFNRHKLSIRDFPGCMFLELYQDRKDSNVFFTYSFWETEAALENYRFLELFKSVWAKTKPMFNAKPEAWSVNKLVTLS